MDKTNKKFIYENVDKDVRDNYETFINILLFILDTSGKENLVKLQKRYSAYFDTYKGVKSRTYAVHAAVPLALLGADVTVFDISEDNKRYASELAEPLERI